ncbi:hypothetical protein RHO15_08385 [Utexia brackfieldae]|uniref:hypothetical protein n=1 Tax=Utexia brackfieldae TaxID=3074108 RepID=UPI00370DCC24
MLCQSIAALTFMSGKRCPWQYQDQRGNPTIIMETAICLARLFKQALETILTITQRNSQYLWGINPRQN